MVLSPVRQLRCRYLQPKLIPGGSIGCSRRIWGILVRSVRERRTGGQLERLSLGGRLGGQNLERVLCWIKQKAGSVDALLGTFWMKSHRSLLTTRTPSISPIAKGGDV
jgi:hypothetical protein